MARFDVSLGEFECLLQLSLAPDSRLRMIDLADRMRLSPSGLTRRLDRLVARDLIVRSPSDEDRRVTMAVLTDAGSLLLQRLVPDHHDAVRRHFISHLTEPEVDQVERILLNVISRRRAAGLSRSQLVDDV